MNSPCPTAGFEPTGFNPVIPRGPDLQCLTSSKVHLLPFLFPLIFQDCPTLPKKAVSSEGVQPVHMGTRAATVAGGSQAASMPRCGCEGFKSNTSKDSNYLQRQSPA